MDEQYVEEFYNAIAWIGLKGTQDYQSLSSLNQTKVQYAIQLVNNY
ncbi:hypothetical protein GCM10009433_10370 [Psychroflexus lacisalsi]|uniref:Uncharacterized protein n=1 Tax=Psychroflexus lacisalsi TaxID=503928 RepID=A0ABN1K5Q4_9FLAO